MHTKHIIHYTTNTNTYTTYNTHLALPHSNSLSSLIEMIGPPMTGDIITEVKPNLYVYECTWSMSTGHTLTLDTVALIQTSLKYSQFV